MPTCHHHATSYPTGAGKDVQNLKNNKDMPEALRSRAEELKKRWMTLA